MSIIYYTQILNYSTVLLKGRQAQEGSKYGNEVVQKNGCK